jgi:hypothetical protein
MENDIIDMGESTEVEQINALVIKTREDGSFEGSFSIVVADLKRKIGDKCADVIFRASDMTIETQVDAEGGRDVIRTINGLVKEVEGVSKPIKQKIDAVKKVVREWEDSSYLLPLAKAKEMANNKVGKFLDDEAARKKAEEAKARAEEERKRASAIAAADKKIAALMEKSGDLSAQIATLQSELANPELPGLDQERIGAQLQALQRKYNATQEKAEEVQAHVETVLSTPSPSLVVNNAPKVAGLSSRAELIPEVINPLALIKAIADGRYPAGLVKEWDYTLLKKLVNGGMNIPGVSSQSRRVMGVR